MVTMYRKFSSCYFYANWGWLFWLLIGWSKWVNVLINPRASLYTGLMKDSVKFKSGYNTLTSNNLSLPEFVLYQLLVILRPWLRLCWKFNFSFSMPNRDDCSGCLLGAIKWSMCFSICYLSLLLGPATRKAKGSNSDKNNNLSLLQRIFA